MTRSKVYALSTALLGIAVGVGIGHYQTGMLGLVLQFSCLIAGVIFLYAAPSYRKDNND